MRIGLPTTLALAFLGVTGLQASAEDLKATISAPKSDRPLYIEFKLENKSAVTQNPKINQSKLLLNGKELPESSMIFGNGPRDQRFTALPAGQSLNFSHDLRVYVRQPGRYQLVWKGENYSSNSLSVDRK